MIVTFLTVQQIYPNTNWGNTNSATNGNFSDQSSANSTASSTAQSNQASVIFVVLGGALLIGGAITFTVTLDKNNKDAADLQSKVRDYMIANRSLLKHDLSIADGTSYNDWAYALKLSKGEIDLFKKSLDGSLNQVNMLNSLDGDITLEKAGKFSVCFYQSIVNAFGQARAKEILKKAQEALIS